MKIAVLSGKGGTGKTFISVNLARVAFTSTYIDCDVEEPNGYLFLKPSLTEEKEVYTLIPQIDKNLCDGCRKCVDFCQFHALLYLKHKPLVFSESCHSCGGCSMVCPTHAIFEKKREVGKIKIGKSQNVDVLTGVLNVGEVSGVPVIAKALEIGSDLKEVTIIDCPPGSDCSVIESIREADCCLLVVEPTAFGLHNFKMVYELVFQLKKKCFVIVNKFYELYEPLENYCKEHRLEIVGRIPYDEQIAYSTSQGEMISEQSEDSYKMFNNILKKIGDHL